MIPLSWTLVFSYKAPHKPGFFIYFLIILSKTVKNTIIQEMPKKGTVSTIIKNVYWSRDKELRTFFLELP